MGLPLRGTDGQRTLIAGVLDELDIDRPNLLDLRPFEWFMPGSG